MRDIKISVPDGVSGNWAVQSFTVSEEDAKFAGLRAVMHGGRGGIKAGTYKKIKRGETLVMSNTPDEIRDFSHFVHRATGKILVNGLGLGVLLRALLDKPEITEITVIEKSQDVIKLVSETYKDKRLTIINADAFEYQPPKEKRYDCVWHDIWDNITSDNIPEMKILHRKYGRKCDYQESWCMDRCKRLL